MSDETRDDETRDDNELTRNNDGDMPGDGEAMAAGSEDQPADEGSDGQTDNDADDQPAEHSDYKPTNRFDASAVHHLSGMYKNWFLDYASYVILERAVRISKTDSNPCSDVFCTP